MNLSENFRRNFLTQLFHVYLGLLAFSIQWEKSRGAQNLQSTTMSTRNLSAEPLKCYSCQTENKDDECYRMNNTDLVSIQTCAPEQIYCKVSNFTAGAGQFRYINRTCTDKCNMGCVHAAASGDFVALTMCYYCCADNFCNTKNDAVSSTILLSFLISCFSVLILSKS